MACAQEARETAEAVARRSYGKLTAFLAARTGDLARSPKRSIVDDLVTTWRALGLADRDRCHWPGFPTESREHRPRQFAAHVLVQSPRTARKFFAGLSNLGGFERHCAGGA